MNTPTTAANHPYILEVSALVSSRTLIYSPTLHAAAEILEERLMDMMTNVMEAAHLPDPDDESNPERAAAARYVIWDFDVRPAQGFEVAGTSALPAGLTLLDTCDDEHCGHPTSPTDAPAWPDHATHAHDTFYDAGTAGTADTTGED